VRYPLPFVFDYRHRCHLDFVFDCRHQNLQQIFLRRQGQYLQVLKQMDLL
jgi:hypothetical protein